MVGNWRLGVSDGTIRFLPSSYGAPEPNVDTFHPSGLCFPGQFAFGNRNSSLNPASLLSLLISSTTFARDGSSFPGYQDLEVCQKKYRWQAAFLMPIFWSTKLIFGVGDLLAKESISCFLSLILLSPGKSCPSTAWIMYCRSCSLEDGWAILLGGNKKYQLRSWCQLGWQEKQKETIFFSLPWCTVSFWASTSLNPPWSYMWNYLCWCWSLYMAKQLSTVYLKEGIKTLKRHC